jgi:enolase
MDLTIKEDRLTNFIKIVDNIMTYLPNKLDKSFSSDSHIQTIIVMPMDIQLHSENPSDHLYFVNTLYEYLYEHIMEEKLFITRPSDVAIRLKYREIDLCTAYLLAAMKSKLNFKFMVNYNVNELKQFRESKNISYIENNMISSILVMADDTHSSNDYETIFEMTQQYLYPKLLSFYYDKMHESDFELIQHLFKHHRLIGHGEDLYVRADAKMRKERMRMYGNEAFRYYTGDNR